MAAAASLALIVLALVLFRNSVVSRKGALSVAGGVFAVLLLLIAYYFLNALTGSGIDESVLFHVNVGLKGASFRDFTAIIAITALCVVAALTVGYFAYRFVHHPRGKGTSAGRLLAASGALLGAFVVNPAVLDVSDLVWKYGTAPSLDGRRVPMPAEYAPVGAIRFEGEQKNLVLLYLESFERTFLDDKVFPGLAPNLNALEQDALSFTDISQVVWSSWTIAGMVASQCGIPLAGSGAGSDEFLPAATCIGDLLNDAGYQMNYLGGASLDFAGKGTFYRTHGYSSVEGSRELLSQQDDPGYESSWGVYDDSLLDLAARRFDTVSTQDGPFGITLTTVDTHHPSGGIVSASCEDIKYQDGSNTYLNAVHCADHMAGNFIRHILSSPDMDHTVLIVLSDHVARPNMVWDILETTERRNMVMAFGSGITPGTIDTPGTTIDLAPTILGLLGAKTGALGYGRDLLGTNPTLRDGPMPLGKLLERDWPFLASLWSFPQLTDGLRVDSVAKRAFLGERYAKLPVLFQLDANLNVVDLLYDMDDENDLPTKLTKMWYGDRFVWVDTCDRIAAFQGREAALPEPFCALAGSLGSPGLTTFALADGVPLGFEKLESVFQTVVPDQAFFDSVIEQYRDNAVLVGVEAPRTVEPTGLYGDFVVLSSGGPGPVESWIINRDYGDRVRLNRGLTLFGLNPDAAPAKVAFKDTCGWGGETHDPDAMLDTDFGTAIEQSAAQFGAFVVVVHLSAVCYDFEPHLAEVFAGTDFREWQDIWYEQPYVAVLAGNGHVEEFVGERSEALALELRDFVRRVE